MLYRMFALSLSLLAVANAIPTQVTTDSTSSSIASSMAPLTTGPSAAGPKAQAGCYKKGNDPAHSCKKKTSCEALAMAEGKPFYGMGEPDLCWPGLAKCHTLTSDDVLGMQKYTSADGCPALGSEYKVKVYAAQIPCGEGKMVKDGMCQDPPLACGEGKMVKDGMCQDPPLACGKYLMEEDGKCVQAFALPQDMIGEMRQEMKDTPPIYSWACIAPLRNGRVWEKMYNCREHPTRDSWI